MSVGSLPSCINAARGTSIHVEMASSLMDSRIGSSDVEESTEIKGYVEVVAE